MKAYRQPITRTKQLDEGTHVVAAPPSFELLESRTLMAAVVAIPAPTDVMVTPVSRSQLDIAWADQSTNENRFVLERAVAKGRFRPLALLPADTASYSDSGLLASTKYRYRVRATTDVGASRWGLATGTTASWVAATPASDRIDVTWADSWTSETRYIVSRATGRGSYKRLATVPADTTAYSDTAVNANQTYRYQVTAFSGKTKFKPGLAAATSPAPSPAPAPRPAPEPGPGPGAPLPVEPSSLVATAVSSSRVNLTWTDNSSDELGFKVERSTSGNIWTQVAIVSASETSYSVQGLSASTNYQFRVRAFSVDGDSAYSNTADATTQAAPVLSPAGFAVTRLVLVNADTDQDVMELTPGVTVDFGVLGTQNLNVRAEASAGAQSVRFVLDGFEVRTENSAPYTLGSDVGGTDYLAWTPAIGQHTLGVTPYALDGAAGDAGAAMSVAFTVADSQPQPQQAPLAPLNFTVTGTTSSTASLAWADNSPNETGFKIERSTDGVNWTQVATVGSGVRTYSAGALSPSTTYHFRVRAYNASGDSAYTDIATATTAEAPALGTKPGAPNTGPTNPNALTSSGSISTTHAGQIIENVDVNGTIDVNHDNVTIRNFRVNAGNAGHAINYGWGRTGLVVEDGEVSYFGEAAVGLNYTNYTARRLNVHHGQRDGFKAEGNVLIENNWVHYLGMLPGAHADGVQSSKGSNLTVRGNNFDLPWDIGVESTSAFMIKSDFGPINNVLIEGNWLNGGQFTIYVTAGSFNGVNQPSPSNVRILNNRFGRDNHYGLYYPGTATTVRQGNVWDDTGAPANTN
jgi:hypothetical protein